MTLSASERETVILLNDEDDTAVVCTHQRTILTKLERHPAATQIEDLTHEGTRGARFIIPAKYVRFGNPRKISEADRAARASRMRSIREVTT